MNSGIEVYFDEDGRVGAAYVTLYVNGRPSTLEFSGDDVTLSVIYPEDVDTIDGEPTRVSAMVLPPRDQEVDGE